MQAAQAAAEHYMEEIKLKTDEEAAEIQAKARAEAAKTTHFDRGELCGFSWNNKLLIKRVIGVPGDWIEMDTDGTIYLNGEKLDEPYAQQLSVGECDLEFPYQVPQEQYFVLGDMRESSIVEQCLLQLKNERRRFRRAAAVLTCLFIPVLREGQAM